MNWPPERCLQAHRNAIPLDRLFDSQESRDEFTGADLVIGTDPRYPFMCVLFCGLGYIHDCQATPGRITSTVFAVSLDLSSKSREVEALCSTCWALKGACDYDRSQRVFGTTRPRVPV